MIHSHVVIPAEEQVGHTLPLLSRVRTPEWANRAHDPQKLTVAVPM